MNDAPPTRFRPLLEQVAATSAWMLVGFCVLEVALPRAGRAAATILLRVDSDVFRWFESTGARVGGFAANGIRFAALLTVVSGAAASLRRVSLAGRIATIGIVASSMWVLWRGSGGDPRNLWWPAFLSAVFASFALLSTRARPTALCAVLLQLGLIASASWALLVSSGSAARPWLDQTSEILVLSGIAGAGLANAPRASRLRLALTGAAFAGTCIVAAVAPDASHSILRHLAAFGNSGVPYAVTAPLFAAAVAGLIVSIGRPASFAALLVALVCARRPDSHLIAGVLASAGLLVAGLPPQAARRLSDAG